MEINKFGAAVGILVVVVMASFVFNIDMDTMCNQPKLSKTITDVNRTLVSTDYNGFTFCTWIKSPIEIVVSNMTYNVEVYDKNE